MTFGRRARVGVGARIRMNGSSSISRRAELVLQEVEALPTLPGVASRLLCIGDSDDVDIKEVVQILESDPALTARLIALCRRAELGLGNKIATVERAVVTLGLEAVRSLVLSVCVVDWSGRAETERTGGSGAGLDRAGFWRHSIGVACGAELLARHERGLGVRPEDAFVAGLVHGLGKLVLDLILPRSYAKIVQLSDLKGGMLAEHERAIIGLDHHRAGKRLAEHWGLPEALKDVMWLYAQRPAMVPAGAHRNLVGLVSLAEALNRRMHIGWSGNRRHAGERVGEYCRSLGIDESAIDAIVARMFEAVTERCAALGLGDDASEKVLLDSVLGANRELSRLQGVVERRARVATAHGRSLATVEWFCDAAASAESVSDALTAIARSASASLGSSSGAVVAWRRTDEEPWSVARYDAQGERVSSDLLEGPEAGDPRSWGARELGVDPGDLGVVEMDDGLDGGVEACVMARGASEADRAGPLTSAWRLAIAGAARLERAERLGEELAELGRTLARREEELSEARSLARLGELTAGAAHEMNNPLTVISGKAQSLAARLVGDVDQLAARSIVQAAQELSDVIAQLHMIARSPEPRIQGTNAPAMIRDVIRESRALASEGAGWAEEVEVKTVFQGAVSDIAIDREMVRRALVEVVRNALEARGTRGITLRVQTEADTGRLMITVTDDGAGMSPHAVDHAFDPFFSEKRAGRQPGLGLATARGLVRAHGGEIRLESEQGSGTCVRIWVPLGTIEAGETRAAA